MTSGTRTAASIAVSSSVLTAAGMLLLAPGRPGWATAIAAAFIVNVPLALLTVGALSASIGRSNKLFMSVAGGGPILRLGLLGGALYVWSLSAPESGVVFALASVVLYLVSLGFEVAFAAQGLGGAADGKGLSGRGV